MQDFETKVTGIKYLTLTTIELVVDLVLPDEILFLAGQHMDFQIPGAVESHSIVSVPDHNKSLKFCITLHPQAKSLAFMKNLKVGHIIKMKGPQGEFIATDFTRDSFFIATEASVSSCASMIPDMLSRGYDKQVQFLFGVKSEDEIFYFDKFSHLTSLYQNFKFLPLLIRPKSHWPGSTGTITSYLDVHYDFFSDCIFYISADVVMMANLKKILMKKGHNAQDVKAQIFA